MRKLILNLSVAFAALILMFVLIEAGFKLAAWFRPNQTGATEIPGLPYENTRNVSFWKYESGSGFTRYLHNRYGMRGPDVTLKKPQNTFRAAFLGDSIMHGCYVNQGEETPAAVQTLLESVDPGERIECLNFGVTSYGLTEYAVYLRAKVALFEPDAVIIGLCLNDYYIRTREAAAAIEQNTAKSWWRERFKNLARSHFMEFLRERTVLGRARESAPISRAEAERAVSELDFLKESDKEALVQWSIRERVPLDQRVSQLREYTDPSSWRKNLPAIRSIVSWGREHAVPVVFFVYPSREQIEQGYAYNEPQDAIRALTRSEGAEYVEMLDVFRRLNAAEPGDRLYPRLDNIHCYAPGHRAVAERVAGKLAAIFPKRLRLRLPV